MRLSLLLPQVLSVLLLAAVGFLPTARAQLDGIAIPGNDYGNNTIRQNNFTDVVQWDDTHFYIKGEKVFIYAAEFHYWRMPVPALYVDIFQKIRSLGFNAVNIYFIWSFHSSKDGIFDFETGAHDIQPLFDIAKKCGLWVIARIGPYVHAETTAGGLPGWVVNSPMAVRSNNTEWTRAWKTYVQAINPIIARNQITVGGPVILSQIENEYRGEGSRYVGDVQYMGQLEAEFRETGIAVPIFHNDPNSSNFPGGAYNPYIYDPDVIDFYAMDTYPRAFDCARAEHNFNLATHYRDKLRSFTPYAPNVFAELQAGAFDPWGGPGYGRCAVMVGPEFVNVYYQNNIVMEFSVISLYMTYGGTNWGHLATDAVYTSYDYGAAISEPRIIRDKGYEGKLLQYLTRVTDVFLGARFVAAQGGNGTFYTENQSLFVSEMRNREYDTGFYVVRMNITNNTDTQAGMLNIRTSLGNFTVPQVAKDITIAGRQSKMIFTDYDVGEGVRIVYSTAEIMTWAKFKGRNAKEEQTVVVLYLNDGQAGEFAIKASGKAVISGPTEAEVTQTGEGEEEMSVVSWTQKQGITSVTFDSDNVIFLLLDRRTAYRFWSIPLSNENPLISRAANSVVYISGTDLVREAKISGTTLFLVGDSSDDSTVNVWAPGIKVVKWNGQALKSIKKGAHGGKEVLNWSGVLAAPVLKESLNLPDLNTTDWKVKDSLPEISPDYVDSPAKGWVVANKTKSTNAAFPPATFPVLYPGEYGFHTGNYIVRARFNSTNVASVELDVWGGPSFGFSTYLNGKFLDSFTGNWLEINKRVKYDLEGKLVEGENILVVLADRSGYKRDEGQGIKQARGIRTLKLLPSSPDFPLPAFTAITLTGNAGAESPVDTLRGPLNEGGYYAERAGWHLPHFAPDSSWKTGNPVSSPGFSEATVKFFIKEFGMDLPSGHDIPLTIHMNAVNGTSIRGQLYINGYQMGIGRFDIGPQTSFPIPPGIINTQGENTIGLALWGQREKLEGGNRLSELWIEAVGVFRSSLPVVDGRRQGLQPRWGRERLRWAE